LNLKKEGVAEVLTLSVICKLLPPASIINLSIIKI